jgi:hypothetical protein
MGKGVRVQYLLPNSGRYAWALTRDDLAHALPPEAGFNFTHHDPEPSGREDRPDSPERVIVHLSRGLDDWQGTFNFYWDVEPACCAAIERWPKNMRRLLNGQCPFPQWCCKDQPHFVTNASEPARAAKADRRHLESLVASIPGIVNQRGWATSPHNTGTWYFIPDVEDKRCSR